MLFIRIIIHYNKNLRTFWYYWHYYWINYIFLFVSNRHAFAIDELYHFLSKIIKQYQLIKELLIVNQIIVNQVLKHKTAWQWSINIYIYYINQTNCVKLRTILNNGVLPGNLVEHNGNQNMWIIWENYINREVKNSCMLPGINTGEDKKRKLMVGDYGRKHTKKTVSTIINNSL